MELRCAPASAPGIAPNDTAAAAASFGGAPISHGGAAAANTTKGGREQSVGGTARPRSALGRLSRSKILNLGAPEFVKYVLDKDGHDRHETDITRRRFWHNPADLVFTFDRWNKHRNSLRYVKHLTHVFTSRIFRNLRGPVVVVMAMAVLVGTYETLRTTGYLPGFPHLAHSALDEGFQLTAFALSLLLVFRTNSSYDRWWEARKIWGGVVNRSRDVVRQGLVFFADEDTHLKETLACWAMAFPKVLMCHLRDSMDVKKEVGHLLSPLELELLCSSAHRPNFILQVISETIRAAKPHELYRIRMDENLTFFHDALGSCERILRTPIPLSYTRHTSRFLLVWLILLPFTLWPVYYWMSIPLSGLFAFLMFGIDEIGVQIEEPFGILPLEAITNTIELNIRELLAHSFEATALATQPRRAHGAPSAHAFGSTTGGIDEDQEVAAVAATGAAAAAGGAAACDHGTEVTAEVCVEGGGRRKSEAAAGGVAGGSRRSVALLTSASNEAQELVAAALQLQSAKSGACGGLASGGSGGLRGGSGGGGSVGRRPIRVASKTEVEIASGGQPISAATTSPQHSLTSGGLATWLHD